MKNDISIQEVSLIYVFWEDKYFKHLIIIGKL